MCFNIMFRKSVCVDTIINIMFRKSVCVDTIFNKCLVSIKVCVDTIEKMF